MIYRNVLFPLLRRFDAERTHEFTLLWLARAQRSAVTRSMVRLLAGRIPSHPVHLFGLDFPNLLGVAAGFDKDVQVAEGLALLGFGHVEVGTLTPRAQAGNPKPRLFRLPDDGALINRMGFPNGGVDSAVPRLRHLNRNKRGFVLGVSMGMQKDTPLEAASGDYLLVMRAAFPFVDYLAINVSSPNTPGLRELQRGKYLNHLLKDLQAENVKLAEEQGLSGPRPLLLKISPDISWTDLDELLTVACSEGVAGVIATNTSLERSKGIGRDWREKGGMSGVPLRERSNEVIAYIVRETEGKLPIIGVGGVKSAADVRAKLTSGASLVQLYTGLVFEGPVLAGRILRALNQGAITPPVFAP